MRTLSRSFILPGLLALVAGCSGGGSSGSAVQLRCNDGTSFCLVRCDLGCGTFGCAVTNIAENQRLRFDFNKPIAPGSVNNSSFSIRTAAGAAPQGDLLVNGSTIEFVPAITVTNGVGSFGFRRNETYLLSIAGGDSPGQHLTSVTGDRLARDFTCTVTASGGILDADNLPPTAELVAPSNTTTAPLDSTIILRFSEVIDSSPFNVALGPSTPIQYFLRRSRLDTQTNTRVCDLTGAPLQVEGVPRVRIDQVGGRPVTVISVKPNINLPGEACVQINVTADVHDLSGRRATPASFEFFTAPSTVGELSFVEDFVGNTRLDVPVSGGTWNNGAHPAQLGGDGRHGPFDYTMGTPIGNGVYQFDTDSTLILGRNTFSGQDEIVDDGKYYFTTFRVPSDVTVRFIGSNPAQIFVRGVVDIQGDIELDGVGVQAFRAVATTVTPIAGQPGGRGGAGGGAGGRGGDRCLGNGPTVVGGIRLEDGQPGGDVSVLAGHAFAAQVTGTGGRGAPMHPSHGLNSQLSTPIETYSISFVFNGAMNSGGGGGGFSGIGTDGFVPAQASLVPAPNTAGGTLFNLLPVPVGAPSSLNHFLVGGSGGGGGGSHTFTALRGSVAPWKAGSGGMGGGGAVAIRGGSDVVIGASSQVTARGGSGMIINGDDPSTPIVESATQPTSFGVAAPGGGGSGGSILIQASKDLVVEGTVNVRGGTGSRIANVQPLNLNFTSEGGNGANGFYRFEAAGNTQIPGTGFLPALVAADNIGPLSDRDDASGSMSLWRGSGLVFPPNWLRYELEVDLDGNGTVDSIFSDDPAVPNSVGPANDPLGPVRVKFQGSRINTTTSLPIENTEGPFRDFVNEGQGASLNLDAATGFRFVLLFNTQLFPNAVVRRLLVVARG